MIDIKNLTYKYNKRQSLFNGLDLTLPPGKIYGLLGKNGAGKSSLMKNITGLLFPSHGHCIVNGFESRKRETPFLEQLFFIPEECQLPAMPITDFIRAYAPFYPGFNREQYLGYLKEFDIDVNRNLAALSFGQKKKAFIAFGLSTNARLLVMDEPTNGLDIPSKIQFRNIITAAFKEDRTIIISTHQVRDLDDLIDAMIIMDKSEVLLFQDKATIARKLFFGPADQVAPGKPVIYSQQTPSGMIAVTENPNEQPSYLDIEILFNAVLSEREAVRKIFN